MNRVLIPNFKIIHFLFFYSKLPIFFFNFGGHQSFLVGPLIPLFQNQGGSLVCMHAMDFSDSTLV